MGNEQKGKAPVEDSPRPQAASRRPLNVPASDPTKSRGAEGGGLWDGRPEGHRPPLTQPWVCASSRFYSQNISSCTSTISQFNKKIQNPSPSLTSTVLTLIQAPSPPTWTVQVASSLVPGSLVCPLHSISAQKPQKPVETLSDPVPLLLRTLPCSPFLLSETVHTRPAP